MHRGLLIVAIGAGFLAWLGQQEGEGMRDFVGG